VQELQHVLNNNQMQRLQKIIQRAIKIEETRSNHNVHTMTCMLCNMTKKADCFLSAATQQKQCTPNVSVLCTNLVHFNLSKHICLIMFLMQNALCACFHFYSTDLIQGATQHHACQDLALHGVCIAQVRLKITA